MRKLIFTAALLALASSAMARDEQKVFKWEDEEGNVYYGDSVPQRFAERPKEVLNEHGVTVAELEGREDRRATGAGAASIRSAANARNCR